MATAHKRFDEVDDQDLATLAALPLPPSSSPLERDSDDEDDEAPEAVSLSKGKRTIREQAKEAQELSKQSALARKAANKALDAKLKARPAKRKRVEVAEEVITPEPAVVEPVKKSKRLDIEPEKTTRLPAAIFEAASAAFKQAKTDHAKEQVEQAKQVAAVRKVKRKRKQRKAATVQGGDSKALGKGVTVQHIVEAKSLSAYDPPPKSMTSAPNEAKRRFMRDQLKRAGPSRADGERRPAHLGIPMSLRQRAPTVGFARSLRRG